MIKEIVLANLILLSPAMPAKALTQNSRIETTANAELDPAIRILNPEHLTGCDEMDWYRNYVGLPQIFDSLGWRESNCRNDVRTFCCYGYWQEYISSHLSPSSQYRDLIIYACGVHGSAEIFGLSSEQKLRQACVTKVVFDVSGLIPWHK